MAVTFFGEPHCFEKATIISSSEHLPSASKATELSVAHDLKESNECRHFTIRGYVAEVRKRDAKKCFPFLLHHCVSLEPPANVFPPLPVSKFRRWDCQNCVHEIIATTGQMDIGAMYNKGANNKNNLLPRKDAGTSQLDARKSLSRLPQNLNENHLKRMSEEKYCSGNISRVGKTGNELLRRDQIHEGVQKYKDGQDSQPQIQDTTEVNCLSYGCNAVNKGGCEKYRDSVGRKKLGIAYVKDALNAALVKHKRSKLQRVGHSKILDGDATSIRINFKLCCSKEDRGNERKREEKVTSNNVRQGHTTMDVVIEKNDVQDAYPAHTFPLGSCCHEKRACGASVEISKCMGTDGERQTHDEVENIHAKKIRKVRLLEDIIRSEKQHPTGDRQMHDHDSTPVQHVFMSRATSKVKVLPLNHRSQDAHLNNLFKYVRGKGETETQNFLGEDKVLEYEVTHIEEKNQCVHQRNQLVSVKRKQRHENHSDDEGPFSMHWVNYMSKKPNANEGEANTKHINSKFLSDFCADLSVGTDQDLDVRDKEVIVRKQKPTFNREHNFGLKNGQSTSNIAIREEIKSKKNSSHGISTSKTVNTEQIRGTSESTGGDAILYSIGNKRPHGDRVISYQDSSFQNKASLKVWEKVSKKPRSNQFTDQEAVDDIPMDIVKLLARNQQERFHFKDETNATNQLKFPANTESKKCSFDLDSSQISRNNVADAEQGSLSCQNFQGKNKGFDAWTTFPCKSRIEYEPKDCSCSISGLKKLQFDLNEQHSDSLIDGAGFCKDINMNGHQLNFSCFRRNKMQYLQSCPEDQSTGCENLSRNSYHNILQPRNGASFGGKSHFLNNSNASILGSNLEIFAHSNDSEKPRNLIGKHHYWGFSPTAQNAPSFMDLTNDCHSNFVPAELYSNETVSALNLLRLMDQAAWSGEPRPHFQSFSRPIKETDASVHGQYNELHLEYGNREKGTCICPLEVNPTTGQQPRNSCLLFRPLPRVGSLGPSLQKEIFNYSNCSSIPTSNSHGFLKTGWQEKIEPSHFNPNTFVCNSQNSLFRCKCSEKSFPDRDPDTCSPSNTRCYVTKVGAAQVELNNKVDALLPLGSFCKREICVVNRNPAEFTVIDENNEYMIEIKELKHKSLPPSLRGPLHGQKKQRIMKLNDLKAFAM